MLRIDVPPAAGTVTLNAPPGPAVVSVTVVPGGPGSTLVTATEIVLPGAAVPVTSTVGPTSASSAGAVTVRAVVPCALLDVAPGRVARAVEDAPRRHVAHQAHELAGRPRQRRGGAGGLAVLEADRRDGGVGAERRAGEVGELPRLLGDQPDAVRRAVHRLEAADRRADVAAVELPLPALAGQHRPQVARALFEGAHGCPSVAPSP